MAASCNRRVTCGSSCNSCTSCQSCDNGCSACIACQNCNLACNATGVCQVCENDCVTAQTYCPTKQTLGKFYTGFAWDPVITANSTQMGTETGMFNKDSWDAIITWINKRTSLPVTPTNEKIKTNNPVGGSTLEYSSDESTSDRSVSPFKASEFNRIYKIIHNTTNNKVKQGDKITAKLFNDLADDVSSTPISSSACNYCNAACDNGCDKCMGCVWCQNCNASCNDSCEGNQKEACKQKCSGYSCGESQNCQQTT